jgi:hypothetical protein
MSNDVKAQAQADLGLALDAASVEPPNEPDEVVVLKRKGDQFGEGVVREAHAIEAAKAPDGLALFGYQDTNLFVATKLRETSHRPYVLIVIGTQPERKREIYSAYRLYADNKEATRLAQDAKNCFQVFLERFALPYETPERWALFTPVLIAKPRQDGEPMIALDEAASKLSHRLNFQLRRNADGTVTLAWPFAVDLTAYMREINQNRQ